MRQANSVQRPFLGNRRRSTSELSKWHSLDSSEVALEPGLPIVDAHHHLYGSSGDVSFYTREDLEIDLRTGHNVIGTIYVEAFASSWRKDGPEHLRSLGEVEMIRSVSELPIELNSSSCQLAAAIVSNVDLRLGDRVQEVLEAHIDAGGGRLKGIRQHATFATGNIGRYVFNAPNFLLADSQFRRGYACLAKCGLNFDALVFHTQIPELTDLADAFPDTCVVLNHVGIPLGVEQYATLKAEVRLKWERDMSELARRPNVRVKIGGMGMPLFGFGFEFHESPPNSQLLANAWRPIFDFCVDTFGSNRCMLESNFPVDKQSCGYAEMWNAFKRLTDHLSKEERRFLFYKTACRTFRLDSLELHADAIADAIEIG